jgi:two-component sensor histidine kinase
MQELISNSLKHAFPNGSKGKIDVSLKYFDSNEDKIELQVVDNGIGLSADWNLRETETLGLQLVKRLSEDQLKGSISVDKKVGAGFIIIFPLKESYHGTIEV